MLNLRSFDWPGETCTLPAGTQLMRRAAGTSEVLYLTAGRVALGMVEGGELAHRMGMVEGPSWLNASCAVLGLAPMADAVAETSVQVQRVPVQLFRDSLSELPPSALTVLRDVALAHRQQAELVISRLAKDAEARCAEWLLRHAEPAEGAPDKQAVMLRQHKCVIAAQLGIAPETLSRVLRHMRERHLISGSGRVLDLLDLPGLRTLAGV